MDIIKRSTINIIRQNKSNKSKIQLNQFGEKYKKLFICKAPFISEKKIAHRNSTKTSLRDVAAPPRSAVLTYIDHGIRAEETEARSAFLSSS